MRLTQTIYALSLRGTKQSFQDHLYTCVPKIASFLAMTVREKL